MTERRIAEAKEHIAQAEKSLKTSFFKWQPDYDSAAYAYEKAGVCLRNAKKVKEAKEIYVKAAEAHRNNKGYYHAAKNYEQAAMLLKEQKEFEEAVHFMKLAAKLYRENGTPDTAALTLEKTAKFVEAVNMDAAIDLYLEAVDVVMIEDRPRQAAQSMAAAARLLVRQKKYDKAIETIQKERDLYFEAENWSSIHRAVLLMVLVHLARSDEVAADKVVHASLRYEGFTDSESGAVLEQLLKAIDEQDGEQTSKILSLPLFKYLDNDYAKLAKTLASQYQGASRSTRSTNDAEGEVAAGGDDEDEGDEGFDLR
ncbi:putative gamma-soluble NSF attachment protein [Apostichopus japonicus]|uniref:Gamma-soluble NSF attachment protein n=1 Tax=Stichopus japonicus TaxID=307972 RepID=A0A2G8JW99_STIJA|nr:putative gamma-soluble NSF attachment protein [Apostichopus japonicus]